MNPQHILVVDDDDTIAAMFEQLLTGDGHRVTVARDGRAALALIAVNLPDLILTDLDMPHMNGFEVCHRIKQSPATRLLPVLMITGRNDQEAKLRAWELGADDFLTKPFDTVEVRTRCRSLLRVKRLVDELDSAEAVVFAFARAVEAKCRYTWGHSERVMRYALALAQQMGLSEAEQEVLRKGAILHDIGKINIPDAILNKPGVLTAEETPPRFPKPREQRDVAGRHYLTKAEINALYFATHKMERPRGWDHPISVGRYWRSALVVFFNYGVDTGTIWKATPVHEPLLWRHVSWNRQSPDRETKETSRWGWLVYRRVKTGKAFYRPMNRVVHAHIKCIMPENPAPDDPVFLGGSARPNVRFQELCEIAGIKPRTNVETGKEEAWLLKDLRKTCATYYDAHFPESSIEILGHSVGGITYRH